MHSRRIADALALAVRVEDLLHRFPKALSGGQRQRVAVGRAIVREPRAFLFDEPLSNLDAKLRGQLRIELKQLHRELNTTMIYVTHDQVEAMTLADRIAILNDGVLQQLGTPDEVYEKPANVFVASFIGSPGINLLHGDLDKANQQIKGAGFSLPLPRRFQNTTSGPVTIGIRPPSISIGESGDAPINAYVDDVETLGWESYVHLRLGTNSILAQVPSEKARSLKAEDSVVCSVRSTDILLFEAESGKAIAGNPDQEKSA